MDGRISPETIVTPAGPLTVRCAHSRDLDVFFELLEEAEAWLASKGIDQWVPGVHRQYAEQFADAIDKGLVYVAERSPGEVAAAIILSRSPGRLWPPAGDDALYVSKMTVARRVSGNGVGLALLQWAERAATAAGKKYVRLDCLASNRRLCRYYEDAGFTAKGEAESHGYRLRLYEKHIDPS